MNSRHHRLWAVCIVSLVAAAEPALPADTKILSGHVPKLPAGLKSYGNLPETNQLRLAIGLGLRDTNGLADFLEKLYDPADSNYQHYLTPEEFTTRFGPTAEDYQAAVAFAQAHHLRVRETHANRLLLDVSGSVADIQRAFGITLLAYHHPSEDRDFYAPNAEPAVDAGLAIADVSGLDNYGRPHPLTKIRQRAAGGLAGGTGSASSGAYIGGDFRAAYLPGVALSGAGQLVGLLQFDGFHASDIAAYAAAAGMPAVPLQTVLLDGYSGTPTTGPNSGNIEVSLDIEMAMSLAPGLSKIVVFEAGPNGIPNDVLNAMAASNQVKQLSCSWGWSGGPSATTDAIFKELAAQGQSFFSASGDSDAYTAGASSVNGVDNPSLQNAPASNPYVTEVGGTTLTTAGAGGGWAGETAWNWGLDNGSYVGSSGGISSYYALPSWQSGVDMSANGGSTTARNIPDAAMVADNVYVVYGNGSTTAVGGTSCAAPLWAALTALINQQAVSAGRTNVGFLNPAIYRLGKSAAFPAAFHDIKAGNNISSSSPGLFYATNGYDLCTGWGTPTGAGLINALSGVTNWLGVLPAAGFTATGPVGGPFSPNSETIVLTNGGSTALPWSLASTPAWLTASPANGTLAAGATTSISVALTTAAESLIPGVYNGSLIVTNRGGATALSFAVAVSQSALQNGGFETGDFTAWTFAGDTVAGRSIYNAVESSASGFSVVHSGSYGAFLGDTQLASLSQSISTAAGGYYLVSFWLANPVSGTPQRFLANWNGAALYSIQNPGAFAWTNLQFLVRAAGASATLQIEAENDPGYFGLDDVSVTPIPVPGFESLAVGAKSVQLEWITAPGLVYQIQYKSNLLQSGWNDLGQPFAATNYSSAAVDANGAGSSPQRFYRLVVTP